MGQRIAIVLFNLGGPDDQASVQPFLQNLFSDPAIIRVPGPIRWALARIISHTRAKSARANYAKMGGGSPLVPESTKQARALEVAVKAIPGYETAEVKAFLAMRYWKPLRPTTLFYCLCTRSFQRQRQIRHSKRGKRQVVVQQK